MRVAEKAGGVRVVCGVREELRKLIKIYIKGDEGMDNMNNNFAKHLYSFGGSNAFLVGTLLYTIASVLSVFVAAILAGDGFVGIFSSIFSLPFLAVPIIALWMIYAYSKSSAPAQKLFPALTLIKVAGILQIVVSGFIALAGVVFLLITPFMAFVPGHYTAVFGVIFAVAGILMLALAAVFIIFYDVPILRMSDGIKQNLIADTFTPIRGVKPFTICSFIMIGFGALSSVIMILFGIRAAMLPMALTNIPAEFYDFGSLSLLGSSIMSLVSLTGTLILVILLWKFNESLKQG